MRHLSRLGGPAAVVGVCVGVAFPGAAYGSFIAPISEVGGLTAGELVGAAAVRDFSVPASQNPLAGNGNPCLYVGTGKNRVLTPVAQRSTCRVKARTPVLFFGGVSCSNYEPTPFFGADEPAQRACVVAALFGLTRFKISVDGGQFVSLLKNRFQLLSPQLTVQLPAGNLFDVPPQTGSFVIGGWGALVRQLSPGRHVIRGRFTDPGGKGASKLILKVSKRV